MRKGIQTIARLFFFSFFLSYSGQVWAFSNSLAIAAEFYFSKHDYRQALSLWGEVLKREPEDPVAVARLAELKLMFEGRAASRELLLQFLSQNLSQVSPESQNLLKEKLKQLGSTFLTDEGQSLFLQALARVRQKECAAALPLLDRAVYLESGNLRVLMEKSRCEKTLGQMDRFYDTAKAAYETDPFDRETVDSVVEGHLFFRRYDSVAALYKKNPELFISVRQKTAVAVALGETGQMQQALEQLRTLMNVPRTSSIHPILFFSAGRLLAARSDSTVEAASYLERFLSLSQSPQNYVFDGWDPYHCAERTEEAKRLLVTLKDKD